MSVETDILAHWLTYLRAQRHYSDKTIQAYQHDMALLLKVHPNRHFDSLTSQDIRYAIAKLHQSGIQPKSLTRILSAWRSFYRWYKVDHPIQMDPTIGVKSPKIPSPIPKALSVEQTQALLTQSKPLNSSHIIRDQAMFELLYSSGLRLSELVHLDLQYHRMKGYESMGWIHLEEQELTVTGKGQKTRILPIGKMALDALSLWLKERPKYISEKTIGSHEYALFLGQRGARIHPRVVQECLKNFGLQSDLHQPIHPHILRHSFASHLLQSSQDLRAVQELLGHQHISTTQIYTKLDYQHLQDVYENAHPRAKRKKKT